MSLLHASKDGRLQEVSRLLNEGANINEEISVSLCWLCEAYHFILNMIDGEISGRLQFFSGIFD